MNTNKSYMNVECISIRKSMPDQVKVGERYTIDRTSIWIDSDGDAYGIVYKPDMQEVGQMKLRHFKSV